MKRCPACGIEVSDDETSRCPADGSALEPVATPAGPAADPLIGRVVAGRFAVVAHLGAGGMGAVYRAVQLPVGREVALKVLRRELADSSQAVARFRREAKAASLLRDPHTVTLYDFGQDEDGLLFLVMELFAGESLAARLARAGPFGWAEALDVAAQVCSSLAEAHEQGVVHRDLKPDNVFFSREPGGRERVKVLDFGIARVVQPEGDADGTLTQAGSVFGTPGYMAPEQAQARGVDHRADLYSLGVLLFEMLAGRPPFAADSIVMLLSKHIVEEPPRFADLAPAVAVPPAVERLVRDLLAKDPAARPSSAREVAERTARLRGEPAKAALAPTVPVPEPPVFSPPGSAVAESDTPPRPRRAVAIAGAAALVVVLGAVAGLLGLAGRAPSRDTAGPGPAAAGAAGTTADAGAGARPLEGPPAATALVDIELRATPAEATFAIDGELLAAGRNPATVQRPASSTPHRLLVRAPGHVTVERSLVFDRPQRVEIALAAEASAPAPDAAPVKQHAPRRRLPIVTEPP